MKYWLIKFLMIATLNATFMSASFAQTLTIPNFWDPNERFLKPDLKPRKRILFLTTTDFPPFNFIDRRKRLAGFHVDLASEICAVLNIASRCQMQAVPWNEIDTTMESGRGDAIIAGLNVSSKTREKYDFSRPFLQIPGRFLTRRDSKINEPIYNTIFRKTVGVVDGSGHQAYFERNFTGRNARKFQTRQMALQALKNGEVSAVFTDAVSASFWLASKGAGNCCRFAGGPYISEEFFGKGLTIAVKKGDRKLIDAFDYALKKINDNGKFEELYLRYFPLGLY